jgi:hypothetical protein
MNRSTENRSSPLVDSRAGPKIAGAVTTAPENAGAQTLISVQCPNRACRKVYTVRSSFAGKDGRCKCGTVFPIPNLTPPHSGDSVSTVPGQPVAEGTRRTDSEESGERPRGEMVAPEREEVTEVRAGCIGRGHAGKTALLRTLGEGPVGDFFPSGLHADAGDPREVAQMIREAEEALRLLHQLGLPPTLKASQVRYCLYDGAAQRVIYQMREVIGQVLTQTLPNSGTEQQALYTEYLGSLVNTDVLWAVIPCPPSNPDARDRRRYANDLRITLAYLREALRPRSPEQPVAVALVLSKIDALFQDAEEARSSLTDEVLRTSFGPLIHLVEQSRQVSDAVIVPVTAFGFGNAVLRDAGEREGANPESEGEPFGSEPIWLLREGTSAQPYNLDGLFIWTLLFGLLNHAGHGILDEDTELGRICRTLAEDLNVRDPWLVPLKGEIAGVGRPVPEMQTAK